MVRFHKKALLTKIRSTLLIAVLAAWQIAFAGAPFLGSANAANSSADLDQCRNGTLTSPDLCNDAASPLGWQNGDSQATQAHWREGDSLPYRMRFDNLSTSTSHSVTIQWDTTKSGKHAIDYLTTFNRTETSADPCYGVSGCGSPTTFAIPTDPNVTAASPLHPQVPGNFTLYNGVITSVSAYTLTGSYSGDSSTKITINFTTTAANPVLAWSGHIASQIDWGLGNSASAISGSPYHMRLLDLDGQGGNQDRALAAAAVFPTPTITTQVSSSTVTVGNTVTDTATLTGAKGTSANPLTGLVAFYICGPSNTNPDCTTGGTQVGSGVTLTQNVLATNSVAAVSSATSSSYTVNQSGNYCFRAEYTPAADAPYSPQNHTNLTTECFTASIPPSTITIIKDAQPNDSQDFHFTTTGGLSTDQNGFNLDDDSDATLSNTQTFNNVGPGVYTVTEQSLSGWDFKNLNCGNATNVSISGQTVTITITGGQSVSCTYTNAERGTLTVHKVTYPANDPTNFSVTASTSNGNIAGSAAQNDLSTSHDVVYDVSQGTYTVAESAASGWSEDDSNCASVVVSANNLNASCTVYNTKLAKLKIVKTTNPASSSQSFVFGASGPSITNNNNAFTLDTNAADNTYPDNYQYIDLQPGSYSIDETEASNWTLTGLTCSGTSNYSNPSSTTNLNVTLAAGDDVTCTFTNTEYSNITGSKLEVNADSSVVQTLSGWTINLLLNGQVVGTTTTDGSGMFSFNNLMSGNYTLEEVSPSGWTQIYAPGAVNLTAGQTSTDNNFGNFQNASISGYKFNDVNGNHAWDNGESGLQGWTITLYDNGGSGALLNHQVAQTTTGVSGSYSFTNLPPTNYKVCETPQSGWTQTYPQTADGCNLVTVALSGHEYTGNNFGNQGRGTITVVKNVDDGFGNITSDVTNWTWGYSGTLGSGSDLSTGSANSQAVAAGGYTVSEDQKTDYHVTGSSCTGENDSSVSTSKSVTVSPGENVVCTFTNTRDTGTITVVKDLRPDSDPGKFNLQVDGVIKAANVGDGGTTGQVKVLTGSHSVSEAAGTSTSLNDYTSSYSCVDGNTTLVSGSGTSSPNFNVAKDSNVVCTFINTHLGQVVGSKFNDINGNHQWDQGEPGLSGWTVKLYSCHNQVSLVLNVAPVQVCDNLVGTTTTGQDGSYSFTNLTDGDYKVCEVQQSGWTQTYPQTADGCTNFTINLTDHPAQSVTANFGNQGRGTITVVKNVDDGFGNISHDVTSWTWGYDGSNGNGSSIATGSANSQSVAAGDYTVSENQKTDYHVTASSCTGENDATVSTSKSVTVSPGEGVVCTFTNTRDTGTITVVKNLYPSNDSGLFNLNIDGTTKASNVGDGGTTGQVKVLTGSHSVSEAAGDATSLGDYQSDYWCTNDLSGDGSQSDSFNVSSNEDITCYFTNVRLGTLNGVKFNDLNGNGSKDQGEPNLSGWTINLYSCNQEEFTLLSLDALDSQLTQDNCGSAPIASTQTDATGAYQFNDLTDGDYKVCEVQQDGWTQTAPDNSGCQSFNINLNIEEGQPGQVVTKDFGNFKNGSISGFKFSDPNGNGQFDSGEVKLSGWTINLNKSDGNGGWAQIGSAVTDSNGNYSFTDLAPGSYQVCEVPQDGWIRIFPTGSDCQTVDINQSGQEATALFANQKKVVPQVLGLVNTGQAAMLSVIAGLIVTTLVTGLTLATRQNKQ